MIHKIDFVVKGVRERPNAVPNTFSLVRDNWDDFRFKTTYVLHYTDTNGKQHEIGVLKIGEFQLGDRGGSPTISSQFQSLDARHFSVGQDREYYERLMNLEGDLGNQVLISLKDIAYDKELFEKAIQEPVTQTSLFRSIAERTVEDQFRRIAMGGEALTRYDFLYRYPERQNAPTPVLRFQVEPDSKPPSNVHVLIGSNGAGKTSLLRNMANAVMAPGSEKGAFHDSDPNVVRVPFVNLVTVTFSAFDPFDPVKGAHVDRPGMKSSYVGLKAGEDKEQVKSTHELAEDFLKSIKSCSRGPRNERWRESIEILKSDPLLADSELITSLEEGQTPLSDKEIISKFSSLSSGHKIVLLTITRLVETVEEKSLVLMDEPEAHLHPPLLSAFTRTVSNLLEDRNGVAIIATHSPVVLQEVPKTCVYRISRTGGIIKAERLEIETFGEDVGALTSAIFGLEVTETGFHQMLLEALDTTDGSYRNALDFFGGQLGGVARAILRSRSEDSGGR